MGCFQGHTVERIPGEDPLCARIWFSGVDPTNRNNVAIRLASYYRNSAKLGLDTTLERMMEWNARNAEPLEGAEITSIVESADKGGHDYSCEDEFCKRGCNIEACPLKFTRFPPSKHLCLLILGHRVLRPEH